MVEDVRTTKGNRTKALILETALGIFRERGFEGATMRAISEAAGVSLGNAYYYFPSKESLIQNFYSRTHQELLELSRPLLRVELQLQARLNGVVRIKIDTLAPYHQFAGVLFRTAGDPASPLHPFSDESSQVRNETIALFGQVVHGSGTRLPKDLEAELPKLLWLYHLGIILFWIHDLSPGTKRTYWLIDRSTALVADLIGLARNPLSRPVLNRLVKLFEEIRREVIA